jgi:hypothetical protein
MTPAWVQAIGSIIAILVAVAVPAWQRNSARKDARTERLAQEKAHVRRLVMALRAEIAPSVETANMIEVAIRGALAALADARTQGIPIRQTGEIRAGSMALTDAVVYRQMAAEIGRLPEALVGSVVALYAKARDLEKVAESGSSAISAYESVKDLFVRFRMAAGLALKNLEKFEASGFDQNATIRLLPAEIEAVAKESGYPLADVLRARGLA